MLANRPDFIEGGSRTSQAAGDLDHLLSEIYGKDWLALAGKQQAADKTAGGNDIQFCAADANDALEADGRRLDLTNIKPNDYPALALDLIPRRFTLEGSRIRIEDSLDRIVRNVPDLEMPKFLEELAKKIQILEINAGERAVSVVAKGNHKFELDLPGYGKMPIEMKDPTFQLKFDPKNPNKIEIVNITGTETKLGKLTGMTLELAENAEGKPVIKMKVTHEAKEAPRPNGGQGQDVRDRLQQFRAGFERAIANNLSFDIPLDANSAEAAKQLLAYGKKWSEVKDLFQVMQQILGDQAELPLIKETLKDITSVCRKGENGEKLEITRKNAQTIELGPLKIKLDEKIGIKLEKEMVGQGVEGTAIKLTEISGITAKLPLPDEVLKQLGIPADVRLREVTIGERKADGTRRLRVQSADHGEISLDLDADGRPVLKDGNLSVEVKAVVQGKEFPCVVTFNPLKAAEAGPKGPDFKIEFKGTDEGLAEMLEKIVGGDLGPADQIAKGLKEIRKEGDKIIVVRKEATTAEFGGLVVEAGQQIEFKADHVNGGLVLKDVKGLGYKIKVELGWLHDALDLGRETKVTNITNMEIGGVDGAGRQKLVVRGDGPFAAVRVDLKDGKIATDPNDSNRGSIYAMIRQAKTEEERRNGTPSAYIAVVLKVDENGNNKMTTGEMTKAAAEAVYMVINKDKFRGYEPVLVNGKELFTAADGDANKAPIVHIAAYDIKVRMNLPFYHKDKGVVLYHNGGNIRAVAPNGDEWELRQRGGYRQNRDKHDVDKTFWVKVEGNDLNWQCHGDRDKAPIVTIPGPEIDVRMHLPYFSGAGTVRIGLSDNGLVHCFGPQGSEWELRQVGNYNQQRDARNPDKTVWVRIK